MSDNMAQQTHDAFRQSTVTISVNAFATRRKATKTQEWGTTRWRFPDGSVLVVSGRGRSHRMVILADDIVDQPQGEPA